MVQKKHKVVLFANGDLPNPERLKAQIGKEDFLIAVDGGLAHMTALDLSPSLIIGDLDSADPEDVQRFQSQGVEVHKYPVDKDETDLELALETALEMNPTSILVAGALGKRLDQTLGNTFLLTKTNLKGMDLRLVDGIREVFLIRDSASITGKSGQRLSLIPLNEPAVGVRTTGLKYPLRHETLYPDRTRGISNYLTDTSATVTLDQGLLLCIHQTDEPAERSD